MRQVPEYFIIGSGQMASHFCHYLSLLNINYHQWSRHHPQSLAQTITNAPRILLLITDSEIENFIKTNACLKNRLLLHFSGSLQTPLAHSAHPLMTFNNTLYELTDYQRIPFIIESEGPDSNQLLPGLDNQFIAIPHSLKAYYHSLCVISNNFTTLLWQKFYSELPKLGIQKEHVQPFLEQTFKNISHNPNQTLTGPIARQDFNTIDNNLAALNGDPFQKIYQAFIDVFITRGQS